MASKRLTRAQELYQAALNLRPRERDAFLSQACADDSSLRSEVEALLAANERVVEPADSMSTASAMEGNPEGFFASPRIGPYKLTRQVGGGGMGAVYLAVRADDQYKRRFRVLSG